MNGAMRQATTFAIAAVAFLCIAAASSPLVTFESPCECRDNHGKHRWSEKNGSSPAAYGRERNSSRHRVGYFQLARSNGIFGAKLGAHLV